MPLELDVPPISSIAYRLFARVVRGYFRRHFRSVKAQRADLLENARPPLIVYGNHSSWWDPMTCVLLARELMPNYRHYAPMNAIALERYPLLRKIGIFPVDMTSTRGASQFQRTAEAVLRDGGVLWVTPQGRFADVREFPLAFRPGLGALAARLPDVPLLPLALEYTFWDDRLPEALLRFGEPQHVGTGCTPESATRELERALAATMLELQQASCARDASAFRTLLEGRRGPGGIYTLLRPLHAESVPLDHTPRD